MPKLVRLYLVSVAIGFALSGAFVTLLLVLDVAGLRHLVLDTEAGRLGGLMLLAFNGVVFSAAQFGISIMLMAEEEGEPPSGRLRPVARRALIPVAEGPGPDARRRLR